jgi:tRNA U34 2-thiouridine synthase MnmA/TrmU
MFINLSLFLINMAKKTKAIVMISGGLDSRLAVKLLQDLGVEVIGLHFTLPFGSGCCNFMCSWKFLQLEGVKMKAVDCTKGKNFDEFIDLIKKPKFGHGVGMNPCIDCRIFILRKAKDFMKKYKADFIATGEVLNERPMSQHRNALDIVEKESGLKGKLLRPLSAKLLPETDAEKKGLIDRNKLLDIQGRQRKVQIELAKKYKITYPSPGGGCLLCEKEYVKKLGDLFANQKKISPEDLELLKLGRQFRIGKSRIIVGRNKEENDALERLAKKIRAKVLECKGVVGPITLLIGDAEKEAAELTALYSDAAKQGLKEVIVSKSKINISKIDKDNLMKLKL